MKWLNSLFNDQNRVTTILVLSDIVLINLAFILAYWVRYDLQLFRAVDPAWQVLDLTVSSGLEVVVRP